MAINKAANEENGKAATKATEQAANEVADNAAKVIIVALFSPFSSLFLDRKQGSWLYRSCVTLPEGSLKLTG